MTFSEQRCHLNARLSRARVTRVDARPISVGFDQRVVNIPAACNDDVSMMSCLYLFQKIFSEINKSLTGGTQCQIFNVYQKLQKMI